MNINIGAKNNAIIVNIKRNDKRVPAKLLMKSLISSVDLCS